LPARSGFGLPELGDFGEGRRLVGHLGLAQHPVDRLLLEGLPNKLIARRLEITEKTVKSHLTRIFREIGVTDRTQAALWAQRNGLVSADSAPS